MTVDMIGAKMLNHHILPCFYQHQEDLIIGYEHTSNTRPTDECRIYKAKFILVAGVIWTLQWNNPSIDLVELRGRFSRI